MDNWNMRDPATPTRRIPYPNPKPAPSKGQRREFGSLIWGVLIGLCVIAAGYGTATAMSADTPTMYHCAGVPSIAPQQSYPEKRVYLETQMWWTPFTMTGKTGHIHVATCFPLYQTVTSSTLHFDIRVQVHDWDGSGGTVYNPLFGPDGEGLFNLRSAGLFPPSFGGMTDYACPTEQCEGWISWDAPIGNLPWSGWDEWDFSMQGAIPPPFGNFTTTANPRTLSVWMMNVQNGKPPYPASNVYGCSDNSCASRPVGGQSWFPGEANFGSKYARANLPQDEMFKLWNPDTGALKPLSGQVALHADFEKPGDRVMIDPAFHAHPPTVGTLVHEGSGGGVDFVIDTTKLSNGEHRLVLQNRYDRTPPDSQSGLLVVPFLVDNPVVTPTTTTTTTMPTSTTTTVPTTTTMPTSTSTSTSTTTTTTPTTTTMPTPYAPVCAPTCDEQIAALKAKLAQIHDLSAP
jgi:hypothetical protein